MTEDESSSCGSPECNNNLPAKRATDHDSGHKNTDSMDTRCLSDSELAELQSNRDHGSASAPSNSAENLCSD